MTVIRYQINIIQTKLFNSDLINELQSPSLHPQRIPHNPQNPQVKLGELCRSMTNFRNKTMHNRTPSHCRGTPTLSCKKQLRRSLSPHITTYHHMHTPQSSKRPRHSPNHLFAGARTANHLKVAAYYVEGRVVERQGFFVYNVQRTG